MIPVNENERLEYVDEKDGIKYFFKALTGENENTFYNIVSADSIDKPIEQRKEITKKLVDFLVVGWEAIGQTKLPQGSAYPADGKPSKFFNTMGNNKLIEYAIKANQLTDDDSKN